jgi:hypothetical protein
LSFSNRRDLLGNHAASFGLSASATPGDPRHAKGNDTLRLESELHNLKVQR